MMLLIAAAADAGGVDDADADDADTGASLLQQHVGECDAAGVLAEQPRRVHPASIDLHFLNQPQQNCSQRTLLSELPFP